MIIWCRTKSPLDQHELVIKIKQIKKYLSSSDVALV